MSDDSDAVVEHRPKQRSCCGGVLHREFGAEIVSVFEWIELPAVTPIVTQHQRISAGAETMSAFKNLVQNRSTSAALSYEPEHGLNRGGNYTMRDASHRQNAELIDRDKCIAYILEHQFAKDSADPAAQVDEPRNSQSIMVDREVSRAEQLEKLDDAEIIKIYHAIKDEETVRRRASYAAREPFLFFNQPSADADFGYWLDLEVWTPDQAAALSMGKEPSVVNADSMRGPLRSSKVRLTYRNRSDAILSAVQAGTLPENLQPRTFIAWAIKKSWALPTELQNWANLATYEQISKRVEQLETEIARLDDTLKSAMIQSMDELDPRLQRTFYKMILSMAIARYEHRIGANSHGPAHIVDDSEQILDDRLVLKIDAVRGALHKAADYLGVTSNSLVPPKWIRIRK